MINFSDMDIDDFMNVSVQKIKNQREVLFVLEMLSFAFYIPNSINMPSTEITLD